jgi:putative hydrolase of the HAD superfamily
MSTQVQGIRNIDAILFDMGGTLRSRTKHECAEKQQKLQLMADLLGAQVDTAEFQSLLEKRTRAYKNWAETNLLELNEVEVWTNWLLPDWPADRVGSLALQLDELWRDINGIKKVFPETREVLLELFRRGYRLGLVSNTPSSVESPRILQELGVAGCFDAVVLSCQVGIRKPNPLILEMSARRMGVPPEHCAYIGDQPGRDVAAARGAGFGRTIIRRDPEKKAALSSDPALTPDFYIDTLRELLDLFPARPLTGGKCLETCSPVYDASLSTMWASDNFTELSDFFLAAGRLGFARIELGRQLNSEKLRSIDLKKYSLSSIHEPCPADITMDTLKARDWLISSTDEANRQKGVEAVKRSLDLAGKLSVKTLVIHSGTISLDLSLENKIRQLFNAGLKGSAEYQETKGQMQGGRRKLSAPHLEAVQKSLRELLEYARRFDVRLGLENRYHYFDIPDQDEMAALLALAGPDQIGFIYDVGHGTAMDRLGLFPNDMWLKRFANRIIGTHLHDVTGILDHRAPGLGDVDFRMVSRYLPKQAFRTIEVMGFNTPEQIKAGMQILVESGCVNLFE